MTIDEEAKQGQNDAYCRHWDYIDFPAYLRIKENSRWWNHLNQKLVYIETSYQTKNDSHKG